MNDYDVRIAHTRGEHVWHMHEDTDEFFLVLEGRFDVSLRDRDGQETTVVLGQGARAVSWNRDQPSRAKMLSPELGAL